MRKSIKIGVIVVVLLSICLCTLMLAGCAKEQEPPVYELKLYDDNWVELAKDASGNYLERYQLAYDGTPRGFNAICYQNGQEFYRYDYKMPSAEPNPRPVRIGFSYARGLFGFPVIKGEYQMYFKFNSGESNFTFDTPLGIINRTDLPEIEYKIIIEII